MNGGKAGQTGQRCQFELVRLLTGTGRSINLHHPFMLNTKYIRMDLKVKTNM